MNKLLHAGLAAGGISTALLLHTGWTDFKLSQSIEQQMQACRGQTSCTVHIQTANPNNNYSAAKEAGTAEGAMKYMLKKQYPNAICTNTLGTLTCVGNK